MKKMEEATKTIEERTRKEYTIKRVYAYKYEDFILSLYSPFSVYSSSGHVWLIPSDDDALPERYVVHKMREISKDNPYTLFREFLKNDLLRINGLTNMVSLGHLFQYHADVISKEDMDMNKWIAKNGQSQSKEELLAEVETYKNSDAYKKSILDQ
jgi:hypothetical protein